MKGMDIGSAIKHRREALGLRQEDLARGTGLARNTISRIEIGSVVPSAHSVELIAEQLNCEVGDLYPPAAPAPHSISEALHRAGVRDRTLSLSLAELSDLFREPDGSKVTYEEAYDIAHRAVKAYVAFRREITPYLQDERSRRLDGEALERLTLVVLQYYAIAQDELERIDEEQDNVRRLDILGAMGFMREEVGEARSPRTP